MPGGLGPKALPHPHTSPVPGCDRSQLLFLSVHIQGVGGAQAISGSEKPGCPAQAGPALWVPQGWGHMAILLSLGEQEPLGHFWAGLTNGHAPGPLSFPLAPQIPPLTGASPGGGLEEA